MFRLRCSPPLRGEVAISTSKNAILPEMAAALLTPDTVLLRQPPMLSDVTSMRLLLQSLGVHAELSPSLCLLRADRLTLHTANDMHMRRLRASILVMGPLLARLGHCRLALPGGCAIGSRPIDLHLKGLAAMGAEIRLSEGLVTASVKRLHGACIYLDFPSVGATENLLMAAALADGVTHIENAAREPEIVDLANLLSSMGAKIHGAGTDDLWVEGVDQLHGTEHFPIPDRIEAGTLCVMASYPGSDVLLRGVCTEHMRALLHKLRDAGAQVLEYPGGLRIRGDELRSVDIRTMTYPGFPTDMQSIWLARLCTCTGTAVVTETLFENRYGIVSELRRMGADIRAEGRTAIVRGVPQLQGARVTTPDLRAGAALLTAALHARGETTVYGGLHIRRGYEHLEKKLQKLGADIESAPM